MREIKFRYWSGKEMAYPGKWLCDLSAEENINEDGFLMQYTGLKDKNGSDNVNTKRTK